MDNIIVSFCIATFQRYEILKELLTEILSVNSDEFEVVVSDNCSTDGSFDKIKKIKDQRLKLFRNEKNLGMLGNFHSVLNHGTGYYLFYINDRDNVDSFKVKKLISILKQIDKENVAFAKCVEYMNSEKDYQIFNAGKNALIEFSCEIAHPTGYIFRSDVWNKISKRNKLFTNQAYGDYPYTLVCAIMAKKYNGALIYGDICSVRRERIDFSKIKSGFYEDRKDKRLWYSPEVQWRELIIAYKFLKKLLINENIIDELLYKRYTTYLYRVVIQYKDILQHPSNTIHYDLEVPTNLFVIGLYAIENGLFLWKKMSAFCKNNKKKKLYKKVNLQTKQIYILYLEKLVLNR